MTNDIYRGFEIEKRADGYYAKLDGAERFGPFARDDKAMDAIDAHYRAIRPAPVTAKQEG